MRPALSRSANFLEALASERGASPNTIEAYRHDLADYRLIFAGRGAMRSRRIGCRRARLSGAARSKSRGAEPLGAASLARRLSAIRQFHKFLYPKDGAGTIPRSRSKGRAGRGRYQRC